MSLKATMTMTMNSGTETMNRLLTILNLPSIKWQEKPHQKVQLIFEESFLFIFSKWQKYSVCFLRHCFMDDASTKKRIPSHQILTLRAQHQYGHIISLCDINDYVLDYQTYSQTQQPTYFLKSYTGELTKEGIYLKVDFSHKSNRVIQGDFLTFDR